MNVAVIGLGPVGIVTAAGLAHAGHRVLATDSDATRVAMIRAGRATVVEPGLDERIAAVVAAGSLVAIDGTEEAVARSEMTLVCVGTPPTVGGSPAFDALDAACDEVGRALRRAAPGHVVVIRSTVPPGTTRGRVVPRLAAASGLVPGRDVHVAMQPEFLREGDALADFDAPPKLVVGTFDTRTADAVIALGAPGMGCVVVRTDPEGAELAKYADNAWHALKVAFANEIGALARASGTDGEALMQAFVRDRGLNVSAAYLRPGAPFGGSCLGKDVAALGSHAAALSVRVPLVDAILRANHEHAIRILDDILAGHPRSVGLVGLAFKRGTADLRDSPYLAIARALAARGIAVSVWDPCVPPDDAACDPSWFAESPEALADTAGMIVVCHGEPDALSRIADRLGARHTVLDLGGAERERFAHVRYRSVAWQPPGGER
jgi:GDP-mannose 6-dehydrogenase